MQDSAQQYRLIMMQWQDSIIYHASVDFIVPDIIDNDRCTLPRLSLNTESI